VRSLQRRHREAVLPKVVGDSDNLRPQGPSQPSASARILPTSGSSPVQVQKDPQGPDGWGIGVNVLNVSTLDDKGVGDSHEDPLKNRGKACLKPAKNAKRKPNLGPNAKYTHNTIHAAVAPAAHQKAQQNAPSSEVRLAPGLTPLSSEVHLAPGLTPLSSEVRLARGSPPPSSGVRLARGSLTSAPAPACMYGYLML
jgi:hypothetical protein